MCHEVLTLIPYNFFKFKFPSEFMNINLSYTLPYDINSQSFIIANIHQDGIH